MAKHTLTELNQMSQEELIMIILSMQGRLDALNENIEKLIEQVRIANSSRFGRRTETLSSIDGQLSFFDEAEALFDASAEEPAAEEVLPSARKKKSRGQRDLNLKEFPEEVLPVHAVPVERLNEFYGEGNWRRMPDEVYKRLRYEPESWTVEVHTVEVYVGTDGEHQDEFLRGNRPKDLLRNSIVTPVPARLHSERKICEFFCAPSCGTGIRKERGIDIQTDHVELDHQMRRPLFCTVCGADERGTSEPACHPGR